MTTVTTSSTRAARSVPPPSVYTGVRLRKWGRWAAEVRVPGTRQKLWIGSFETGRQAALAYDAAIFCFYGVHLPKGRKFNYPAVPRPNIPAWVRVQLDVAYVKEVAERHARAVDARLPPLEFCNGAAPLVASATAAAGPSGSGGEGASSPHADNANCKDGKNLVLVTSIDAKEVPSVSADGVVQG